jgi:hypothetical protein
LDEEVDEEAVDESEDPVDEESVDGADAGDEDLDAALEEMDSEESVDDPVAEDDLGDDLE